MAATLTSSATAQRLANQMDREKRRIEAVGIRQTAFVGKLARAAAVRAFKSNASPAHAAVDVLNRARPTIARAMLAANLQGRVTAQRRADGLLGKKPLSFSNELDRAIERLHKEAIALGLILGPRQGAEAAAAAFNAEATASLSDAAEVVAAKIADALAVIGQQNLHTRGGISLIRDAFDAAGVTVDNPYALETIFRKNVGAAYTAGRLAVNAQPHIASGIWGYEYIAVMDDRTRPTHAALDGVRKPKNDPFWLKYMPPWSWGCRCSVIEIFHDEEQAVDSGAFDAPPGYEGFAVNPALELLGR